MSCLKTWYLFLRNLVSGVVHRPRWALSMIASFLVVGFVSSTAIPVLMGLNAFYSENQSNVYSMQLRDGTSARSMRDDLNSVLETFPGATVKLFSPCSNSAFTYLVGQNDQRSGMDIAGEQMKENLSGSDPIAWLGQGFWDAQHDLHFPYSEIKLNGQIFNVAGITDPGIYETLSVSTKLNASTITDAEGNILPLYDLKGEVFGEESAHIEDLNVEDENDDGHDHGFDDDEVYHDYGYNWQYSHFSVVIPLTVLLEMDLPVSELTLFLVKAPNSAEHKSIVGMLAGYLNETPARPQKGLELGITQILAIVTILAAALCLMQLISAVRSDIQNRWKSLYSLYVVGCSPLRLVMMLLTETILWQCIGFALCILPAKAVVDIATQYANPRILFLTEDVIRIGIGNTILICAWYILIVSARVRKMLRNEVMCK